MFLGIYVSFGSRYSDYHGSWSAPLLPLQMCVCLCVSACVCVCVSLCVSLSHSLVLCVCVCVAPLFLRGFRGVLSLFLESAATALDDLAWSNYRTAGGPEEESALAKDV